MSQCKPISLIITARLIFGIVLIITAGIYTHQMIDHTIYQSAVVFLRASVAFMSGSYAAFIMSHN